MVWIGGLILAALLTLIVVVMVLRRAVLRTGMLTSRQNELLAIDKHAPDMTEETARISRVSAENYLAITELRALMANLTLAVDEGVRHVSRAEKRVARTIQSTRKILTEHGLEHSGLEAEHDELRDLDGGPSEEEQLRLMPTEVGEVEGQRPPIETGIPGYEVG